MQRIYSKEGGVMDAGTISIIWLVVLAILLVIEFLTLGLTTVWFAGGISCLFGFSGRRSAVAATAVVYSGFCCTSLIYQTSGGEIPE